MGRSQEESTIDDLKRSCPLVEVDAQYSSGGWRIRGKQIVDLKPVEGQPVIDVKALYLKTAKKLFGEAYSKALTMGILKKHAH